MKINKFIISLLLACFVVSGVNAQTPKEIIEKYRLMAVYKTTDYYYTNYIPKRKKIKKKYIIPDFKDNNLTKIKIGDIINDYIKPKKGPDSNTYYLLALLKQTSYKGSENYIVNNYTSTEEKGTLHYFVEIYIIEQMINSIPDRETDPQFNKLESVLRNIVITAYSEIKPLEDKTAAEKATKKQAIAAKAAAKEDSIKRVGEAKKAERLKAKNDSIEKLERKAKARRDSIEEASRKNLRSIEFDHPQKNLVVGDDYTFKIKATPPTAEIQHIKLEISNDIVKRKNPNKAITNSVTITAIAAGSATLRLKATGNDGNIVPSNVLSVEVKAEEKLITGITIVNKDELSELKVDDEETLNIEFEPDDATQKIEDFETHSSDPNVVKTFKDDLRKIVAKSAGTAKITTKSADGSVYDDFVITVIEKDTISGGGEGESGGGGGQDSRSTWYFWVIIIILLAAIGILLFLIRKMNGENSQKVAELEAKIKNLEGTSSSQIQKMKQEHEKNISELLNELKDKDQLILSLKRKAMEQQQTVVEPKPSPPSVPAAPPEKYATVPDVQGGFSVNSLKDRESDRTVYKIIIESENSAIYRLTENVYAIQRALQGTSTVLAPACDYENSPSDGNLIKTVRDGKLKKSGDVWQITQKVLIKFV